jgi:hypothetical protein
MLRLFLTFVPAEIALSVPSGLIARRPGNFGSGMISAFRGAKGRNHLSTDLLFFQILCKMMVHYKF